MRYVVRTGLLDRLLEVCEPVLALSWDDPQLAAELAATGAEVVRLPEPRVGTEANRELDQLARHFRRRIRSSSTAVDRRRVRRSWSTRRRIGRAARDLGPTIGSWLPGDRARRQRALERVLDRDTNVGEYLDLLDHHRIQAVFSVTPFVVQEQVLLWAAERRHLPLLTSILSFDNLTTRPPLPVVFDRYLVWNRHNRAEVLRGYPSVAAADVRIVGPAQFDFYADRSFVVDEAAWRAGLGLEPGAPTVLYGAGAEHIAPHETQHVDQLVDAIRRGVLPADLRVVLRRHPLDRSGRWDRFTDEPLVHVDDPGGVNRTAGRRPGDIDLGEAQVVGLCSSLAHADVHVSVSSTMTLDGAFFGRPQVGPAFDARPGGPFDRHARDLYRREHFVPIVASGGMALVHDPASFVAAVARALHDPERDAEGRRRMLVDLATTTDGRSTERVAVEVERFLADHDLRH